jgi:hypothetical protein
MMFSHTTIRFSYGLRLPGTGRLGSIISGKVAGRKAVLERRYHI